MHSVMEATQVYAMLVSFPLFLSIATYMFLSDAPRRAQRESGEPSRFWHALTVLVAMFAIVSLRDWIVFIEHEIDLSPWGWATRIAKVGVGLVAAWYAWKER